MENIQKALEAFEKMDAQEKRYTLLTLLNEGKINMVDAISAYGSHLEQFKRDAKNDMRKLSEAGLSLGEKAIKRIPAMKSLRPQQLAIAQTHTLLSGGGYHTTPYAKELASHADLNKVDKGWYEECWKLAQPNVPQEK